MLNLTNMKKWDEEEGRTYRQSKKPSKDKGVESVQEEEKYRERFLKNETFESKKFHLHRIRNTQESQ